MKKKIENYIKNYIKYIKNKNNRQFKIKKY